MHSYTGPRGTTFIYDGDFSGQVQISNATAPVPAEDLVALVAHAYVRPRRMRALEDAGPDELLGVAPIRPIDGTG